MFLLSSSPAGMIEGTPQLHVSAWKVSSACISPVNIPIIDPCEMNQQNGIYVNPFACPKNQVSPKQLQCMISRNSCMMLKRCFVSVFYAAQCDVLVEEVFAPCHAYVSPSVYHQQCRYQACRCGSVCLCTALSHYAYICSKHHITINFRAHVSECGSLVIPTCICLYKYLLHKYVQEVICLCVYVCRYGVFRWDDVSPVHISMREDMSVNQQC